MTDVLKSPFPYFGGKSRVADIVWGRLGDVDNFVEPFAGSLAVLLRRPQVGKVETVNDANHFIVNFWRAVRENADAVAKYADWPVTEADLHARHEWLVNSQAASELRERFRLDPCAYDARTAGWWVWGQCCWIGGGWCSDVGSQQRRPQLGNDRGVTAGAEACLHQKRSALGSERGVVNSRQIPDMSGDAGAFGRGVVSSAGHNNRPQLGDAYDIGRGVNGNRSEGACEARQKWLREWMAALADRLRLVRVCYGHWSRVCDSKTTMNRLGVTGVFLDPPYAKSLDRLRAWIAHLDHGADPPGKAAGEANRGDGLYAGDETQDIDRLVAEVHVWARRWGIHDDVRIALCGYANRGDNENKTRERIWFSPACRREDMPLFAGMEDA